MKRKQQTASPCTTSPPQPSPYAVAKAKIEEILFTDRLLVKYFGNVATMQNEIVKFEAHWLPLILIVLLYLFSLFVSQSERFDHWFTAFLCGASVPALFVTIAVISVPDIIPQTEMLNPLPEVLSPLPEVLKP